MSTLRVNAIQDATGGDLVNARGMARAWVNFNGTGTVAIRAAHNVSSITDNGTGRYTVNFTSAMLDADYTTHLSCTSIGWGFGAHVLSGSNGGTPTSQTANSVRIGTTSDGGSSIDSSYVTVAIFR